MSILQKPPVDLANLAFVIREISSQVDQLDEEDLETLEILLDDETLARIREAQECREYVTAKEVFDDDL